MTLPVSDHVEAVTQGYAGAIGGMYVICIWGVTQMAYGVWLQRDSAHLTILLCLSSNSDGRHTE